MVSKLGLTGGLTIMSLALLPAPAAQAAADAKATLVQQCRHAYRQENLPFVLQHCPEEAWALARAQCEREADTVAPRYAEFCQLFYTGTAPSYGR